MRVFYNFVVSLLVMSPIFISIGTGFDISFDRVGGGGYDLFIISIPLSIIIIIAIAFSLYKDIFYSIINCKIETVFLAVGVVLNFSLFFIYSEGSGILTAIKTTLQILFFFFFFHVFSIYFEKNLDKFRNAENVIIFYPLAIITFISLFSSLVLVMDDFFLISQLVIYDFRQYYAFIFVITMGVFHSRGLCYFILATVFSVYFSILSGNDTSLAISLAIVLIVIVDFLMQIKYRKILLNIIIFSVVVFALLSFFAIDFYLENINKHPGLVARREVVIQFFESFNSLSIVFPFFSHSHGLSVGYHNQFIVIYNTLGLIGFLLYYFIFFKRINYLVYKVRMVKVSIVLVVILGGITVIPTIHFYTAIFIAYILSFYIVLYSVPKKCNTINSV